MTPQSFASPEFWDRYRALPQAIRMRADKQFDCFSRDPRRPSLQLKPVGRFWSVSITQKPGHPFPSRLSAAPHGLRWRHVRVSPVFSARSRLPGQTRDFGVEESNHRAPVQGDQHVRHGIFLSVFEKNQRLQDVDLAVTGVGVLSGE